MLQYSHSAHVYDIHASASPPGRQAQIHLSSLWTQMDRVGRLW